QESQAAGGAVVQWTLHRGANQQWKILPVGDGSYYLLNVNSGQALNVAGASMSDGADVIQWPYGGEANSRWLLQPVGAGVRVKAARSNASPAGGAASGKSGGACGLLGLEVLLALGLCRRGSRR
ncbi:MAG TPA: RICIN domain-containing protein, partial [Planctomycetota bacterium]|nr:RICIN domain-containing protein [Planctomycetota bacterium]